jgi:hypothetical protein
MYQIRGGIFFFSFLFFSFLFFSISNYHVFERATRVTPAARQALATLLKAQTHYIKHHFAITTLSIVEQHDRLTCTRIYDV